MNESPAATGGSLWAKTFAVGLMAAVGCGLLAYAASQAVSGTPAANAAATLDSSQADAIEAVSAEFAQAQTNADALPADMLDNGVETFVASTSRSLGTGQGANYWIAANADGDVCLILQRTDGWGAATCQPPDYVQNNGLSVQIGDVKTGDPGVRALLLPQDLTITAADATLQPVGNQLLIGAADVPATEVHGKRADGTAVTIGDELKALHQ